MFNYLIKLFGHSGSSNKHKKQAWLPKVATNEPTVANTVDKNAIFIPPFYSLYSNIKIYLNIFIFHII